MKDASASGKPSDSQPIRVLRSGFGLGGWVPRTLSHLVNSDDLRFVYPINSDEFWMSQALVTAMGGIGKSAPNPTVGCVFVKAEKVLSRGVTQSFGGLHAEAAAIEHYAGPQADFEGSSCYVTLEPCSHYGKQAPCVDKLIRLGIKRCVIACQDPYDKVNGEGILKLRAAGVEVTVGVLEAEAMAWHLPFLLYQKKKRTVLVGKWAQTLDGKLADDAGNSKWITGPSARAHTHWLRQKYDAILVGSSTVLADRPRLNVRDCAQPHNRHPLKLVFDPNARLLDEYGISGALQELLVDSQAVVYGIGKKYWQKAKNSESVANALDAGLIPVQLEDAKRLLGEFIDQAAEVYSAVHPQKILQSVFIEGGPRLLNLALNHREIDAAHAFLNPSFMGPSRFELGAQMDNFSGSCAEREKFLALAVNVLGQDTLIDMVHPDRWRLMLSSQ